MTGAELPHLKFYGKPNPAPYRLIEAMLLEQAAGLGLTDGVPAAGEEDASPKALDADQPTRPLPFSSVRTVLRGPCAESVGRLPAAVHSKFSAVGAATAACVGAAIAATATGRPWRMILPIREKRSEVSK